MICIVGPFVNATQEKNAHVFKIIEKALIIMYFSLFIKKKHRQHKITTITFLSINLFTLKNSLHSIYLF